MKQTSQRMQNLPGNYFADLEARIAALQATGCDVIRLDIGSPDLSPSVPIVEALTQSANQPDSHGYQPHAGSPALRRAWAAMYQRVHQVELDENTEIVPLLGSKEGIFHLTQALAGPGDIVLVPDPGYMTYTRSALFAGAEVFPFPLLPEDSFLPDLDSIPSDVLRRSKMLWLNYPNNPTGAVANLDFFSKAVEFARQHDLLLCHDAAYTQVVFDGFRAPSLLEVPGAKEVGVEMNSLSKSHNMAGWRVGVAAGNREALQALFRLKTNLDSGHFLPIQQAAIVAMTGDQRWIDQRNEIYRQRRDILVLGLQELGLAVPPPPASIYVWVPIPKGWNSMEFTTFLLENAHVSLAPGTIFGKRGEGYVRFSLTTPTDRLITAVERMVALRSEMERK